MKNEHVNDINNYQKLYMQYAPMLLRFAGKFISPFFAEDIVHDVFLRIWDKQLNFSTSAVLSVRGCIR